jgi:transcriptional regulator with XRE-family HTH domain
MIKIIERKIKLGKGLKDATIAELCGVTRQTVWNWRRGKCMPTKKHLAILKKLK